MSRRRSESRCAGDVQTSVQSPVCCLLPPPAAAATKWADWGSNRRLHIWNRQTGIRTDACTSALPLGHYLDFGIWPPCCLGAHLPLTKNPNCVYLSDCLLAGSGTDWLTVNLSSRCTAEGNRIFTPLTRLQEASTRSAYSCSRCICVRTGYLLVLDSQHKCVRVPGFLFQLFIHASLPRFPQLYLTRGISCIVCIGFRSLLVSGLMHCSWNVAFT